MNKQKLWSTFNLILAIFSIIGGVIFGVLLFRDIDNLVMNHIGWLIYGVVIAVVLIIFGFYVLEKKEDS